MRGKLSALPGLRVIAGGSAREYKKSTKSLAQIGRELGVDYLLVGKVRWAKQANGTSRVLVSPELVQLAGGTATTRWQQPFDTLLTDVFKVQADIASKVAQALDVALGDSTQHTLAAAPTANLAAYDAFLKGEAATQEMSAADPPSLRRGMAFYQQAVALDTNFARAWSRLSAVRSILYFNSAPTPELAKGAREAAERVESIAPKSVDAASARGRYASSVEHDPVAALAAFEGGLELAPNDVELLTLAASMEQSTGRWELALKH